MPDLETHRPFKSYALPKIDGQVINIENMQHALQSILQRYKERVGFTFFTLNLDHLVKRRENQVFLSAYQYCDFVCADGFPLVWLTSLKGKKISRTTGADLLRPICQLASSETIPVYFFGSSLASLQKASHQLKLEYPNLTISGFVSPSMDFSALSAEADFYGDQIAQSGAALCFVLLGAPKQELFAHRQLKRHPHIGFLCFGAALDFVSHEQKRAPMWMQNMNLEWFWRLITNPRRMARRYFHSGLLFIRLLFQIRSS